jgi:outer membrane protein
VIAPALLLLAGTCAWSQVAPPAQRIAVVDLQGAVLQTKDGQKAAGEMKAKFGPKEEEMSKRNQDLQAKEAQYQKTAATMSDTARAGAEHEIQDLQKVIQRDTEEARADVQAEENRLFGPVMQKMQAVMQKYAADNKFTMIVDISAQPNNLLYADKSANITAEVIALYDKSEGAPAAPKPAAAPAPVTPRPAAAPPAPAKKP